MISNTGDEVIKLKSALIKIYEERNDELLGIFLIVIAILLGVSLYFQATGVVGEILTRGFKVILGRGAYILPFLFLLYGINLIKSERIEVTVRVVGLIIMFVVVITILHLDIKPGTEFKFALEGKGGGIVGALILYILRQGLEEVGTYIVLGALGLIGFLLAANLFLANIISQIRDYIKSMVDKLKVKFNKIQARWTQLREQRKKEKRKVKKEIEEELDSQEELKKNKQQSKNKLKKSISVSNPNSENNKMKSSEVKDKEEDAKKQETKNEEQIREGNFNEVSEQTDDGYNLPPLSLLQPIENVDSSEVNQANSQVLEETLSSFGVEAEVVDVNYGPTITRYEIHPAPGVKVSKISNLSNDIALSLAASDVRIEAPIPGKAAVGIEVPNQEQVMVHLREILESSEFTESSSKLSVGLGKDIAGKSIVADLSAMPHLLVAGATGSGKSVCINSIISSLLYKGSPEEIKMMLIDPKMVELAIYNKIPHLIAPVVTDARKAAAALKWVVEEMENRYELFASNGAKGIKSYNQQFSAEEETKKLPYIVVVIDELSDLMMVAANEVEDAICRLAQMARAAGIHLIIATQRPSVDVITGVIKANIPSRISFAVSSQTDSRTILDTGGAEKLLGKGDMLFSPVGSQKATRIQGAFISESEVKDLVKYVKEQENPEYAEKLEKIKDKEITIETEDKDELYEEAVKLVVDKRASISMLQRRLRIGYTRAARLIDTMEEEGIVGEHRGSKPREVLIDEDDLKELFNGEGG